MEAYDKYDRGGLLHDRYVKVTDISEGSYGLVSLAKDTKLGNALVAVKYIYPVDYERTKQFKQLSNTTGRATLSPAKLRLNVNRSALREKSIMDALCQESAREINILKILGSHANITNLVDCFDSCLVLEYCARGDMYEAMQNDLGPATSQDIKDVFLQILSALSYCHSKLVYHRDLKPENILISQDWTIKVCDWGLATTERIVTDRSEFDIGSERYMAPELFSPDLEFYDAAKVDLWSVGVILLTLVFHKNPFQVANYTDKRFLQFSANREALFDFFSTMSGEMFGVLRFCLNLDPLNRDLDGLCNELDSLRYFTVDEEYWAENSDDEYEDNGYEEDEEAEDAANGKADMESEDEMFKFEHKQEPMIFEPEPLIFEAEKEHAFIAGLPKKLQFHLDKDDVTDSDTTVTTATTMSKKFDDDVMPYNRRADALLSPNTDAKPIPIGGASRIRNTRKPFGVASYNKNGACATRSNQYNGSYGAKYRREDFFTPRSVFVNYMNKYGTEREQQQPHQRSERRKKWNRGRRGQLWKKRGQENGHALHHPEQKRRQTKKRPARPPTGGAATPSGAMPVPQGSANYGAPAAEGKYIPPFLRLPAHATRSPQVGALVEEMDDLQLSGGVFHLDGDFGAGEESRRAEFATESELMPGGSLAYLGSGRAAQRRLLTGKTESDKYIPPFRRGSHSGVAREKRRSFQPHGMCPTIQQVLLADETLRSVPGDNWLLKKDWQGLK